MKWIQPTSPSLRHSLDTLAVAALAAILATASSFAGGDEFAPETIATQLVPTNNLASANTAKNLARMNCGAQIEWTAPDRPSADVISQGDARESAVALIMEDGSVSCPLPEGQTTFVIKLPAAAALDRFTFVNENAEAAGELKISVSNYRLPAASPKWVEVDGSVTFSRKRLFNLSMVGVEARYVKLAFQVEKAGRIAALGLYGGETLEHFAWRQALIRPQASWVSGIGSVRNRSPKDQLNFNFANLYARARVVYVSSGALASAARMIDDDSTTGFHFAASDKNPTVVVELNGQEQLHRVSAFYNHQIPGRFDVYLLNEFSPDSLQLEQQEPVASVTDADGVGKGAVEFEPHGARYVALRWMPANDTHATQGFEIAGIDVFGNMSLAMLTADETPDLDDAGYNAVPMPGEGPTDIGSRLGILAIPPALPQVSP